MNKTWATHVAIKDLRWQYSVALLKTLKYCLWCNMSTHRALMLEKQMELELHTQVQPQACVVGVRVYIVIVTMRGASLAESTAMIKIPAGSLLLQCAY